MKKHIGLLLAFVLFGLGSNVAFSRGGSNPTVTVVPTITHGTCFNPEGVIDYEILVESEWENQAHMNRLDIYNDVPEAIYSHPDESLLGTANNIGVGVYTISGSVSALNSNGMWVGIPFNITVWVGIQTVWVEKLDMILDPNSYSAKQNVVTNNFGGVLSSNEIDSGDGWMEMKAQYGGTNNSNIYWIIGMTDPLGAFSPNDNIQYVKFFKTSTGNGINVKYQLFGGGWNETSISFNPNDKVRVLREGTSMRIQLNDDPTTAFMFETVPSGPLNIAVRSQEVGDGCLDVISSFPCRAPKMYANLKYKLDGFHHTMKDGKIRFVFDQEYDEDDLTFNIYNHLDLLVKDQTNFPALSTTNGDNYLTIDVSDNTHCIGRGFFYLEVINSKKEKMYLRFFNDYQNAACNDYISEGEATE